MNLRLFFIQTLLLIFLLLLLCIDTSFAQDIQPLENEIERYEQKIIDLEKQIAINSTNGNLSDNSTLKQEIESHEQKIANLLKQIKQLQSGDGANQNDCELEIMSCRKEIEATEKIVEQLEEENLDLQKEIQRLTMQGGGSAEIERLQKKVELQKNEIQVLKQQIQGYRKNQSSSGSKNLKNQILQLKGTIRTLELKNQNLQRKNNINTYKSRSNITRHGFQKQFISQNATNLVFGYKYTLLPSLNYKEAPKLYQSANDVGTFISVPTNQVTGHNGFFGLEFLWHGSDVGGNLGIAANYSHNVQEDMMYHILGFQFSPELTILPIRIGIKPSAYFGYTWGKITNNSVLLNNASIQRDPEFGTMIWGWDAKLRVYISRFVAFTGTVGSDYPLDQNFELVFWDTSLKFGVGIDILIPTKIR